MGLPENIAEIFHNALAGPACAPPPVRYPFNMPSLLSSRLRGAMELASRPSQFDGDFNTCGARYGIDPKLLKAVGVWESGLNPGAFNREVGATGIMQVSATSGTTPSTNPGENICQGAAILRQFLNKSNGNMYLALARYNGGYVHPNFAYASNVLDVYKATNIQSTGSI